jgi:hypothetical protein
MAVKIRELRPQSGVAGSCFYSESGGELGAGFSHAGNRSAGY